jgi:CRISPR-associated protein Cmr4
MHSVLLYLYAESPIHAGGSDSLGVIDLPIQREATTSLPVIWGQSLKGALRERARRAWPPQRVVAVFGTAPPGSDSDDSDSDDGGSEGVPAGPAGVRAAEAAAEGVDLRPGSLQVGDAQLVAFPVPTLRNCFAWVTSPVALGRLGRKLGIVAADGFGAVPQPAAATAAAADRAWAGAAQQVLGPVVLACTHDTEVAGIAAHLADTVFPEDRAFEPFRSKVRADTMVVPDAVLSTLTLECTEVAARVQLKEKVKTVANGRFYSEHIPAETILAAVLTCCDEADLADLAELLDQDILRIGGDETIGKGLAWCRVVRPAAPQVAPKDAAPEVVGS